MRTLAACSAVNNIHFHLLLNVPILGYEVLWYHAEVKLKLKYQWNKIILENQTDFEREQDHHEHFKMFVTLDQRCFYYMPILADIF